VVLCQFTPTTPSVAVSSLSLNGTGLSVVPGSLSEVRPDGSVAAVTELGGLNWSRVNASTEDAYDLSYTVHAPLVATAGSTSVVGSADLGVDFVLPAYTNSPAGSTDTVTARFAVSNWTWQAPGDTFRMTFDAWPTFARSEHLAPTASSGWILTSSSNASGTSLERLGVDLTGLASPAAGPATVVNATPSASVAGSFASIAVTFGGAGAFRSLEFSAHVGIVLPATVAGIPIADFAAAAATAALASLLIAAVARRARRRPSDLIYVEDSE
jgi:hypothetical protein